MRSRQDTIGRYRVEYTPFEQNATILGVVLDNTFVSRLGERVCYNGQEYQLECPATATNPLRLIAREGGAVVELSPEVAEKELKQGNLRLLD